MSTEIHVALQAIWRNLPTHPSTFSACGLGCGRGNGRGGGPCIACAQDALARDVGEDLAAQYVTAARQIRILEDRMQRGIERKAA